MNTVQIESRRNVFGTEKWYPANKEAELFAGIAGQKTLDPKHFSMIRSLGFTVEQCQQVEINAVDEDNARRMTEEMRVAGVEIREPFVRNS